ncbi:MAG: Bug family tripartite tricarboxylate transporter substrate binding protein [Burkholderiales bacterium]
MPRHVLKIVATGFALATAAASIYAQTANYPNRAIKILVGYPPGGATDIVARVVGNALALRIGQAVVVENKAGSASNIAALEVARAEPDGYTLLHGPDNLFLTNPQIYGNNMPLDPLKDLVAVSSLAANQLILAAHPSVKANNLREFADLARASKPPLFYASIGNGSMHHIGMEILKEHLKIDLTHVPYKGGGPAGSALLAGDVQVMFGGGSLGSLIAAGKVRALGATGAKRSRVLPDVPTIGEIYPGYEVLIWHGTFAPAKTPQPILERLHREISAALQQADVAERLIKSGSGDPYITTREEFAARIRADSAKFGKVVGALGIKLE